MAKALTHAQLMQEWKKCIEGNSPPPNTLARYYEGLLKLIYKELLEHGEIQLQNLGTIYTSLYGGREINSGLAGRVYVEPRLIPRMGFSENLKTSIKNDQPYLTKQERKKRRRKVEVVKEKSDEARRVEIVNWLEKKEATDTSIVDLYDSHVRRERAKRNKLKNGQTKK